MTTRPHIFDFTPETLSAWCVERGMKSFTAKQILEWVYRKGVTDPEAMTNLSAAQRAVLADEMRFLSGDIAREQHATDGTRKLLITWHERVGRLAPGTRPLPVIDVPESERQTETVMIPADDRRTACVSSQVGCPVGCRFCASGLGGLAGNLNAGRIVEQVVRLNQLDGIERITNVVFMGMGEPLSNYQAVTDAIRTLNAPWGCGIGARRITVSTVGLPAAITKLASFEIPVTLALSLHAPNDAIRRELIPWAEYATIAELFDACTTYFDATGREITLEYLLLGGVNDQRDHATELAGIAQRIRANVNLIRYNEVDGLPYVRPETDDVRAFQTVLRKHGVSTHIRASRGRDIAAACGQLRAKHAAASG